MTHQQTSQKVVQLIFVHLVDCNLTKAMAYQDRGGRGGLVLGGCATAAGGTGAPTAAAWGSELSAATGGGTGGDMGEAPAAGDLGDLLPRGRPRRLAMGMGDGKGVPAGAPVGEGPPGVLGLFLLPGGRPLLLGVSSPAPLGMPA